MYHSIMRHALIPLTIYLPESFDGDDQHNMFDTTDYKSYEIGRRATFGSLRFDDQENDRQESLGFWPGLRS